MWGDEENAGAVGTQRRVTYADRGPSGKEESTLSLKVVKERVA